MGKIRFSITVKQISGEDTFCDGLHPEELFQPFYSTGGKRIRFDLYKPKNPIYIELLYPDGEPGLYAKINPDGSFKLEDKIGDEYYEGL